MIDKAIVNIKKLKSESKLPHLRVCLCGGRRSLCLPEKEVTIEPHTTYMVPTGLCHGAP